MWTRTFTAAAALIGVSSFVPAIAIAADAPSAGAPQFSNLRDGDTVSDPVVVQLNAGSGMTDQSAQGMPMGHVHLIIDSPMPEAGHLVPMDAHHIHLMHGESETTLQLDPGDHTLQLVFAGPGHKVGTPPVASDRITIHVVPGKTPSHQ